MSQEQWNAVDAYVCGLLLSADAALQTALADSAAAALPQIQVSPPQGKMLMLLARLMGARRILELGTLGGYSAIWLGRGLVEGGRMITLELRPEHADVARANIERAGLGKVVEVRVGSALELLPTLTAEGPFDLIFIDADKVNSAAYFQWAVRLARVGSLIIIDNVVRKGAVVDEASADANVQGVRRALEAMAAEPRVSTTVIQTVGGKGYDGFAMGVVVPQTLGTPGRAGGSPAA